MPFQLHLPLIHDSASSLNSCLTSLFASPVPLLPFSLLTFISTNYHHISHSPPLLRTLVGTHLIVVFHQLLPKGLLVLFLHSSRHVATSYLPLDHGGLGIFWEPWSNGRLYFKCCSDYQRLCSHLHTLHDSSVWSYYHLLQRHRDHVLLCKPISPFAHLKLTTAGC
jgi:hypothetical protein